MNPELNLKQTQEVVRQTGGNYEQFRFIETEETLLDGLYGELREYLQADDEHKQGELADVFFYLVKLADKKGYDLNDMAEYVFTKNIMRTNPNFVIPIMEETGLTGRELYNECKRRSDEINGGTLY